MSIQEDDAFWQRVFDKAEQRERQKILANYAASKPAPRQPAVSAKARWNQAIDEFVAQGLPREKAAVRANAKYPHLRLEMVAAANRR